jgi:GH24 family phage-related lysozyme (muramidase)
MPNPNTISFSLWSSLKNTAEYASLKSTYDLIVARVTFVLLDDSNKEKFDRMGGWKSIGAIECIPFINFNDPTSDPIIAKPINSNITRLPLENELVTLRTLVSKEAQNNLGNYKPEIYYTDIISVFNAPEDNAAPDASFFRLNPNSKSVTGNYVSTGDNKRLLKAPGDITIEGRRGSSIRFGSNAANFNTPWQSSKPNPILILSNNPAKVSGSVARFEDVNKDGTVLVMMSGHNINFQAASNNFDSYNQTVVLPEAKNNIVVVDQVPKSKPTESLQQEDAKPIPVETLPTGSVPVATSQPIKQSTPEKSDEEELPEREDLMTIQIEFETYIWNGQETSIPVVPGDGRDVNNFDYSQDWIGIAYQFIASEEGFLKIPRFDANRVRGGYGSDNFVAKDGTVLNVTNSTVFTKEDAERTLRYNIVTRFQNDIIKRIGKSIWEGLNDNQKAALVSFTYNAGVGAFGYNGLDTALKTKKPSQTIASIIEKGPITSRGKVLQVLIKRRKKEASLYLK